MRDKCFLIFVMAAPVLVAVSVAREPLAEDVYESSTIARVEVLAREEQTFAFDGGSESCGFAYRLAVKDALKGEQRRLVLLAEPKEVEAHVAEELFVMAFRPGAEFREKFLETIRHAVPLIQERAKCLFRSSDWYFGKRIMRFDRRARVEFGGEWLRTGADGLAWTEELGRRQVEEAGVRFEVVSWELVRQAVISELRRSE